MVYNNYVMKMTQKMAQRMVLTPQMRQSIHILQLPLLELRVYVDQQIEENPALEDSREDTNEDLDRLTELSAKDRDDSEDYFNAGYSNEEARRKKDYREHLVTKQLTLQEHLLRQLGIQPLNKTEYKIAEFIIGNIDENGYFQSTIDEVTAALEVTAQEVENVLSLIQTFEPVGVGARNLKECLLIQLRSQGKQNSLAYKIIERYLVELAKNKTQLIARGLKVPLDTVNKALKKISLLESKPGKSFARVENRRILPDIIIEKKDDSYEVIVNGQKLPPLKISSYYKNLVNKKNTSSEVKKYLKEKLSSALYLIKAIEQRQETIRNVAKCIIRTQKEFFEQGKGHLKPLTMKQVAEMVGRNPSTISRVVNNKYIQTPFGIFELNYFFSGSFKAERDNREGTVSTDTVRTRVANLIEREDPKHPLSDSKIVNILRGEGLDLARRTVAKYREELKILPSHFRKRQRSD